MDLKQLEAFVNVATLGSFSKAADKLYLTQPTISTHIGSLERELGTQLIVRTPKEAYPSETGKILYEYALDMLSLRDKAMAACKNYKESLGGPVSIAASTIPYQHVLPRMMAEFRVQYPEVMFNILSSDSGGVVSHILAGKAEIGMTGAVMDTAKCTYESFTDDYLVVVTPNAEPFTAIPSTGFPLGDLMRHPLILRESGSGTRKEAESFLRKHGLNLDALDIAAQMDSPDAIKNSVSQGLGISIMSQLSCADYERFGLVRVFRLEGEPIARKLYLVRHKSRPLSPVAASFLRFVSARYSEDGLAAQREMMA